MCSVEWWDICSLQSQFSKGTKGNRDINSTLNSNDISSPRKENTWYYSFKLIARQSQIYSSNAIQSIRNVNSCKNVVKISNIILSKHVYTERIQICKLKSLSIDDRFKYRKSQSLYWRYFNPLNRKIIIVRTVSQINIANWFRFPFHCKESFSKRTHSNGKREF